MSRSAIACRSCSHVLARKHHSGNITFEVGIRVVLLRDGRVQAQCPCGDARVVAPSRMKRAA